MHNAKSSGDQPGAEDQRISEKLCGSKNKPYIIECNPRVGGASTLSIQNGLDAFFWQMKKIINERFVYKFKKGKKNRLFRFPVDFYLK